MALENLPKLPVPHDQLAKFIAEHPDKPMAQIMEPYRQYEAQLRNVFAQDRKNPALDDPMINVLPLFNADTKHVTTRARNLKAESQEEKDKYIMPLAPEKRRAHGSPAVVGNLKEFQKNFGIFSESSLADLDWSNVVAAGSSVVNCVLPVPAAYNGTKRKLREYYHQVFCPASDVDLFLYGLTHEEAIEKIKQIEQSIRDAILTEVTVVRTKYAITIASQYPTRHVQIVLRVYKSISEILTGFDIDAAGGAYDGSQVYVTPRALGSFITQCNQIDLSRRSPSYENRLSKYSHRDFEIYWPDLERSRIDPTIFERSFRRTLGLARLLVLERLPDSSSRDVYINKRRQERGRPTFYRQHHGLRGNIKDRHEDEVADWVDEADVSNYHTFTVPYGEKFHAKKIEKLCYTRDLLLNAEWNQPKEREVYLHRHPAFFGRVEDVIEDCCGSCPQAVTDEEKEAAQKEAEIYISGKVSFLIDDPGRQQIGSFNPLTQNDWTDMAYVGNTARLCQAIVDGDVDDIRSWLTEDGADVNKRDYTGRSPLHLAVMSSTPEVVRCLVENGARLTARLVDGRTALHIAAANGNSEMIKILMEKSTANEEAEMDKQDQLRKTKLTQKEGDSKPAKAAGKPAKHHSDDSEEDDQDDEDEDDEDEDEDEDESDGELIDGDETEDQMSMATGSFVKVKDEDETKKEDAALEESSEDPDYYDVNILAWDVPCSPLHLAVTGGHEDAVRTLCEFGSDAILPVKFLNTDKQPTAAILSLVLALCLPTDKAKSMAQVLLDLGATSSQADLNGLTAFHSYVKHGDLELVNMLLDKDKLGAQTALKHLCWKNRTCQNVLMLALSNGDVVMALRMLEAGASPGIDFDSWLKSAKATQPSYFLGREEVNKKKFNDVEQPILVAIKSCPSAEIIIDLLDLGADPNTLTDQGHRAVRDTWSRRYTRGETILDLVRSQIETLSSYQSEKNTYKRGTVLKKQEQFAARYQKGSYCRWVVDEDILMKKNSFETREKQFKQQEIKIAEKKGRAEKAEAIKTVLQDLEQVEKALVARGAKSFYQLHPDIPEPTREAQDRNDRKNQDIQGPFQYDYTFGFHTNDLTEIKRQGYIKIFEAAWSGDIETIKAHTCQGWGASNEEPPLNITVTDSRGNSPFSLAFLMGHYEVAKSIIEIAAAQYAPDDDQKKLYKIMDQDDQSVCTDDDSEVDSEEDSNGADDVRIVARKVSDKKFTIDNIGEISMQVKSKTKPISAITGNFLCFEVENGLPLQHCSGHDYPSSRNLFEFTMDQENRKGLKVLIDLCNQYRGRSEEEEGAYSLPEAQFLYAIRQGKIQILADVIKATGSGVPLDYLVKKSGVEMQHKPKYYQGLTVYGKKRKDWATAGRNLVVRSTGLKTAPLLHAALAGNLESTEWFLGDAPHRCYVEFGQSKVAQQDPRLKHLLSTTGGLDRAVSKWLGNQNDFVIHCAVLAQTTGESIKQLKYLVEACPEYIEKKAGAGYTPLQLAFHLGRLEYIKVLIKANADQSVRTWGGKNIIHSALELEPSASSLRKALDLIDPSLRSHLFGQRNNLSVSGTTPLHSWLMAVTKKFKEEHLEVFNVILEYSKGEELAMLNGAGDTCLHSCIIQPCVQLAEALLKFRPSLLYRENAVGRTPAELARETMTAIHFASPSNRSQNHYYYRQSDNAAELIVGKDSENFEGQANLKSWLTRPMEPYWRSQVSADEGKPAVWELCERYIKEHPAKRRLVSLHEANDVAKRLGESYSAGVESAKSDDDDAKSDTDDRALKADFIETKMNEKRGTAWSDGVKAATTECEHCGKKV